MNNNEDLKEIFDVISGKKNQEKKEKERQFNKKLVSILPKKIDDDVKLFADEVKKIQEDISVKKSNALGLSLLNVLKKSTQKYNPEVKEEQLDDLIKQEIIHDLNLSVVVKNIVINVVQENDKHYNVIFQLAVGALYKYIKEDLVKILCKEKDVLEGKVKYYDAKYNYVGGMGGSGSVSSTIAELEEEIDRLNNIIVELNAQLPCPIYKTWGDFTSQTWGGVIK
jgi:hypothetical protein